MRGNWPDDERRYGAPGGGAPGDPDRTEVMRQVPGQGGPTFARRYRLDQQLGTDELTETYAATDLQLNRPVVLTVFRPALDDDRARRFLATARPLTQLHHPALVAVLDAGVEGSQGYLVREQVDGQTLRSAVAAQPFPPSRAAAVGAQISEALAVVHEQGVAHRDVTPDNVVLGRDGRARLADLGVSELSGILTGRDPGTDAYLAPEQVRRQPTGRPADIYALGLVLLETLSGRPEYPGAGWESAAARLSRAPEVGNDVPGPLARVLLAMTSTDPGERPTARALAGMLGAAASQPGGAGTPVGPVDPEPARRNGWRIAAIAIPIVLLFGLLSFVIANQGDDEPPAASSRTSATATPRTTAPRTTTTTTRTTAPTRTSSHSGDESGSSLPSFSAPDIKLPELPDAPSGVGDDIEKIWNEFKDWVSTLLK